MRVSETLKLVPVIESSNYGSAGIDAASVNMALLHSLALDIQFGALTGNSTLILYAGATTGAKTTALAFSYRLATGAYKAANADGLGDLIAVPTTGLVLTAATFQHKKVVIEVRGQQMTDGQPWLTASIDNVATVLNVNCEGVGDPRYATHNQVTVL